MKKWRVKLIFLNKEAVLPGEWDTRDNAEWDVARWKQKVGLYTDPFIYFQEEEKKE